MLLIPDYLLLLERKRGIVKTVLLFICKINKNGILLMLIALVKQNTGSNLVSKSLKQVKILQKYYKY